MIIYRAVLCIRWNADDADLIFIIKLNAQCFWAKPLLKICVHPPHLRHLRSIINTQLDSHLYHYGTSWKNTHHR